MADSSLDPGTLIQPLLDYIEGNLGTVIGYAIALGAAIFALRIAWFWAMDWLGVRAGNARSKSSDPWGR